MRPPAERAEDPIFSPKLFSLLPRYSWKLFAADLSAGTLVGIVALPLAIAFAIASGVTPDRGLVTAVVAGFLISLLGGSRVQIGGPTGAFVVIVYGILRTHGMDGLVTATMMAGAILILLGVFRLGGIIRFIPYPLIVGFTSGIAVVIFTSQVGDFLGLATGPLPGDFLGKWAAYARASSTLDPATLAVGAIALAILLVWPKIHRTIPAPIVALVAVTALVHWFAVPVETVGSRFGDLPHAFPHLEWPSFSFARLRTLLGPAFVIALLGAIESLLSATVADGMVEGRHRPNTELVAQGIANLAGALFGGIPATGAVARTATNAKNGAKTPVAGIVHAVVLLLIVLFFGRWIRLVPLAVLAAILVVISYHMSEWFAFRNLLRAPRMDVAILIVTFLLTVLVDLTVAVEIGMILAMIALVKRMTEVTTIRQVSHPLSDPVDDEDALEAEEARVRRLIPRGVDVYEAEGAFFFGAASRIRDLLRIGKEPPRVLILRMERVFALDASGLRALEELRKSCARARTQLILQGLAFQPLAAIKRSGHLEGFGRANLHKTFEAALARAREILGPANG
jgi:SulP family sulfate permease